MADLIDDLELDEKYVVELISRKKDLNDLAGELNKYFGKYSELSPVEITFDEIAKNWVVKTKKGEKEVEYPEGIPQAIKVLRE
ncbi:hypothetical protein ACFLZB_03505 [Nanoarchaeota archaeon]